MKESSSLAYINKPPPPKKKNPASQKISVSLGKEENNSNESEKGEKVRFIKGFIKSTLRRKFFLGTTIISEIENKNPVMCWKNAI